MSLIFVSALAAFAAAVLFTVVVRKAARALGVLDRPDGVRKLHRGPVPLLGGIAVFGAWMVGMTTGVLFNSEAISSGDGILGAAASGISFPGEFGLSLVLAAGVVLITGILDDVLNLRPRWKLLGQTIAASILVAGGLVVKRLWLFGFTADLGWLGIALTVVWLVGSMNAVNMLDGLDGLASTVGLVIGLTLACMAWLTGNAALGLVAMALAGALAGFLVFNYPPASIFLGDSGSMLIGLIIGAVAIQGSYKAPATAALAAPIAVLAIPIFDGVAAVIRRRLNGKAVYAPDRGHIHHCLQRRGWSSQQILFGVGTLCFLTGSGVLLSLYFRNEPIALLTTLAVGIGCIATKMFGNYEYALLLGKPKAIGRAFRSGWHIESARVASLCSRLRQCRTLDETWTSLVEAAGGLRLERLDLEWTGSGPPLQTSWTRPESSEERPVWQATLPLLFAGVQEGQLQLRGHSRSMSCLPDVIGMGIVAETLAEVLGELAPGAAASAPHVFSPGLEHPPVRPLSQPSELPQRKSA